MYNDIKIILKIDINFFLLGNSLVHFLDTKVEYYILLPLQILWIAASILSAHNDGI
jgi:hypothetical protein